jgi:metal-dependent hydrolase (beta-lactamase superfamily II)
VNLNDVEVLVLSHGHGDHTGGLKRLVNKIGKKGIDSSCTLPLSKTMEELRKIGPDHVIPCHCTGRKAMMQMEQAMPGQFILNMSGTTLTFRA